MAVICRLKGRREEEEQTSLELMASDGCYLPEH